MFTLTYRLTIAGLASVSVLALPAAVLPTAVGQTAPTTARTHSVGQAAPRAHAPDRPAAAGPGPANRPPSAGPAQASARASALTSTPTAPASRVTCVNDLTLDTAHLLGAISNTAPNGRVTIGAGTCALTAKLPVRQTMTIDGAGASQTFIVQHTPQTGIFGVHAQHVTVENVNLNTASANPGTYGSSGGTYAPGVIFSDQSYTSVLNVTAEVGDGFGMRITGSNPCSAYPTVGTVVTNVTMTNTGTGGRASIDIDCTDGAQINNVTIHGQFLALYVDENVTLNGELYTPQPFMGTCHEPWYVSGPASNITISGVTGGGRGISAGTVSSLLLASQVRVGTC